MCVILLVGMRRSRLPHDNLVESPRIALLLQELEPLGWIACWKVAIDVRLARIPPAGRTPQLKRDLLGDTAS
jgi:hypothetical protein